MDDDAAASHVEKDVHGGLADIFRPVAGEPAFTLSRSAEGVTAIEWEYTGVHSSDFVGIPATNQPVTIRGVTLVEMEGSDPVFRRYVDWLDVCGQIGLSLGGRPGVAPS